MKSTRSSAAPRASKGYLGSTHRTISPAETLERIGPHLDGMGITRVANVTGLDRIGIPVVMVVRPNSRAVAVSQGKGLDLDAAKASGLMESIETWHAERLDLPLKLGSEHDLSDRVALVDVASLPDIDGGRYTPDLQLLWIEGYDLGHDAPLWLPYEMVHTNYCLPRPTGNGCFPASTNGLASGNHPIEATCHAICEIIERDATTLWHLLDPVSRASTRVVPNSVDDPACRVVLDAIADAGLDVIIWETTTDIGVAAFYCLLTDPDPSAHLGAGAGCHPCREVSLLRALTEAVQTRTTYIAGSRDDLRPDEFTRKGVAAKREMAERLAHGNAPARAFDQAPTRVAPSHDEDLDWLLERLSVVGLDTVVTVDLSRPGLDLAVVRAVIPGLEAPHDDAEYIPGPRACALLEHAQ